MNTRRSILKLAPSMALAAAVLIQTMTAFALSMPIGRDINFPKDYDPNKAAAIRKLIQDERFKFVEGTVSYWPPDYGTRLSFDGNVDSLNKFIGAVRQLPRIGLHVIFYHGRNDELRRDSPWQLDFSQAAPDRLTVYINLNASALDLGRLKLPDWPPQ